MRLELRDKNDNFLESIEVDNDIWEALQKKAKEWKISEEKLFNIIMQEYAKQVLNEDTSI